MTTPSSDTPAQTAPFSLTPLMFQSFAGMVAMMAFVALAGPIARVAGLAPWQIGAAMTVSGIAWMVMARVWGGLSDRRGRRPVILTGLAGFAVSYALLSLFVDLALRTVMAPTLIFAGLLICRGFTGLFYAAVPSVSAALVADHVPPQRRGSAMAAIGAAGAVGMVVGPGFAGLVAPLSLTLPLYLTALLPIVAFVLLWLMLPRTEHHAPPNADPLRLADPRLRRPMTVAFVAMFSVAVAQVTVGFYALDRLQLEADAAARVAGIALAVVGIALTTAQVLLRRLGWPPARLIRTGSVISGLGFAAAIAATTAPLLWACYAVASFGMGWVFPSVSALAANAVEAHEQGAAAGTVAAAQGLGAILGPLVGTAIYAVSVGAPYLLVGVMLLVVSLMPHAAGRASASAS